MTGRPPLSQDLWVTLSPEAQAAVSALVQSFERRIADLEERINKNSTNSSRPPSSDPPSVKRRPPAPASGKKRGGQPGHRRQARPLVPPEQLRRVIDCKPPECRWCHQPLQGDDPEPIRHQVAELPPVQPTVDEYRLHRLVCPRCRTSTCASLPPGVPRGAFGPRLRAILSVLAGGYRLGKRPVRQLAFDLLGLTISVGMICRLERQSADELEAPVEELREYVREAAVAHIDETSWWQGRDRMWLWTAVTRLVTVFAIAPSRSDTRSPKCRRSGPWWTNTGSIGSTALDAAPPPVRPCRRGCLPGRSARACGPSSASWPGATAWASAPSASWSSTCWA
ncbi:MAG TPA: DUF6444 domain-containing protein [Thermoanaerobaculia bacterium]